MSTRLQIRDVLLCSLQTPNTNLTRPDPTGSGVGEAPFSPKLPLFFSICLYPKPKKRYVELTSAHLAFASNFYNLSCLPYRLHTQKTMPMKEFTTNGIYLK